MIQMLFTFILPISAEYLKSLAGDLFLGIRSTDNTLHMTNYYHATKVTRIQDSDGIFTIINVPRGRSIGVTSSESPIITTEMPALFTVHITGKGGFLVKRQDKCLSHTSSGKIFLAPCNDKTVVNTFIFVNSKNGQRREKRMKSRNNRIRTTECLDTVLNMTEIDSNDIVKLMSQYQRSAEEKQSSNRDFVKLNEF